MFFLFSVVYKYTEEEDVKTPRHSTFHTEIYFLSSFLFLLSYNFSCFEIVGDFPLTHDWDKCVKLWIYAKSSSIFKLQSFFFLLPLCQRAESKKIFFLNWKENFFLPTWKFPSNAIWSDCFAYGTDRNDGCEVNLNTVEMAKNK